MTAVVASTSSRPMRWAGLVVSVSCVLFLLMDSVMQVLAPSFVVRSSATRCSSRKYSVLRCS
jgi:hypothetical protein